MCVLGKHSDPMFCLCCGGGPYCAAPLLAHAQAPPGGGVLLRMDARQQELPVWLGGQDHHHVGYQRWVATVVRREQEGASSNKEGRELWLQGAWLHQVGCVKL